MKAPLEVVCILKGLAEDKEMLLADGRKIVADIGSGPDPKLIPIHPGTRIECTN